jgi:hypothetical protein
MARVRPLRGEVREAAREEAVVGGGPGRPRAVPSRTCPIRKVICRSYEFKYYNSNRKMAEFVLSC